MKNPRLWVGELRRAADENIPTLLRTQRYLGRLRSFPAQPVLGPCFSTGSHAKPDVNVGPNTGYAGKAR